MHIRIPSKRIRERFLIIYELEGCPKAINFLTGYYEVKRMKIVLNGKKVGNGNIAIYFQNKAYFTKKGLKKRTALHELYHHLVHVKGFDVSSQIEENEAKAYARQFLQL